jgi:hypothetical protein
MRRFRDLMGAHKKASFGAWILVLVAVVAGAQWQLTGGDSVLTQVLGASQSLPPAPTIVSGPSNPTSSTSATFTYADTQNGLGFQCQLDSAAFSSCAKGGVTYTGLSAGSHTFRVEAQQGNGPLSAPATSSWTVAPPTAPTITVQPDDVTSDTGATFGFTDTQSGVSFQCQLDSGPFSACTTPKTYNNLSSGDHVFSVRVIDSAGNPSSVASFPWTVATGNFGIRGDLTSTLAPGVSVPLNLVFTNPYTFSGGLKITGVTVTVQQATVKGGQPNPACPGPANIAVTQASFTGPLTVPRTSTRSLSDLGVPQAQWPQIAMRNLTTNQDVCKNTTFNFTYTGTATK